MLIEIITKIMTKNGLVMSFIVVAVVMWASYAISKYLTKGRIHGSAIAITMGLVLAYFGGVYSGGSKGLSDVGLFSGIGVMGGSMLRDFAIISTSFGAKIKEIKKAGLAGAVALFTGIISSYIIGAIIALLFGYTDAVSIATIGAGAVTFIVGPVTGVALGASSEVIALSIGAGVIKSIAVMVVTPMSARFIGLNNPQTAMVFGGLMGTTSGTAAGLAATDPKLVPYGAMVATFFTGLGCLLCPSVLFYITKLILG